MRLDERRHVRVARAPLGLRSGEARADRDTAAVLHERVGRRRQQQVQALGAQRLGQLFKRHRQKLRLSGPHDRESRSEDGLETLQHEHIPQPHEVAKRQAVCKECVEPVRDVHRGKDRALGDEVRRKRRQLVAQQRTPLVHAQLQQRHAVRVERLERRMYAAAHERGKCPERRLLWHMQQQHGRHKAHALQHAEGQARLPPPPLAALPTKRRHATDGLAGEVPAAQPPRPGSLSPIVVVKGARHRCWELVAASSKCSPLMSDHDLIGAFINALPHSMRRECATPLLGNT
eukprot:364433-Chlamydomonas_euryale.AAC.13